MASYIKTVTWDCADALRVARFWAAALGTDVDEESTPDRAFVEAAGWGGPNMWFVRVPEAKTAKNRVHFDLRAPGPVADEVARLTALGATVLAAGRGPDRDGRPGGQRVLRRVVTGGRRCGVADQSGTLVPWATGVPAPDQPDTEDIPHDARGSAAV